MKSFGKPKIAHSHTTPNAFTTASLSLLCDEYFSFTQVKSQEEAAEYICKMYLQEVEKSGVEKVQILSPFRSRGDASTDRLNEKIREAVNPPAPDKPEIARGGMTFRLYDKVMQKKNDSSIPLRDAQGNLISKGVFNGEVGQIRAIRKGIVIIKFDSRYAEYTLDNLEELELAYATTVHKAMGSEYDTVIFPVLLAHKIMLDRNVFYTAITRAKSAFGWWGRKKLCSWQFPIRRQGGETPFWVSVCRRTTKRSLLRWLPNKEKAFRKSDRPVETRCWCRKMHRYLLFYL